MSNEFRFPTNIDDDVIDEVKERLYTVQSWLCGLILMKELNVRNVWDECDPIELRRDFARFPPRKLRDPVTVRVYRLPHIDIKPTVELAIGEDGIVYQLSPSPFSSDYYGSHDIQPPYPLSQNELVRLDLYLCAALDDLGITS